MKKYRYTIFDSIMNFYNRKKGDYYDLIKEEGYKGVPPTYHRKWDLDKICELEKAGYKHNVNATERTGGDNDYIVIDHLIKEWCFWENGFYPFTGYYKNFPQNYDLEYWANNRK